MTRAQVVLDDLAQPFLAGQYRPCAAWCRPDQTRVNRGGLVLTWWFCGARLTRMGQACGIVALAEPVPSQQSGCLVHYRVSVYADVRRRM